MKVKVRLNGTWAFPLGAADVCVFPFQLLVYVRVYSHERQGDPTKMKDGDSPEKDRDMLHWHTSAKWESRPSHIGKKKKEAEWDS